MGDNRKINCRVGDKFQTNQGDTLEVIEVLRWDKILIKFSDYSKTGFTKYVRKEAILNGHPRNPYFRTIYNTGYLGEGLYPTKIKDKHLLEYKTWVGMLERCYDPRYHSYHRYGGRGITVCDEWHNYQNFAEWCNGQEHFGITDYQLDKDLLNPEEKQYNPQCCSFIPKEINILLAYSYQRSNGLPRGVTKHDYGNYLAKINTKTGNIYLGNFPNKTSAFLAYKENKELEIRKRAEDLYKQGLITKIVYDKLLSFEIKPYQ